VTPSSTKYRDSARAVSDLPRIGNRSPSEDESVPPPKAAARGWRWWALMMSAFAGRSVSSLRYHWVVQSSVSTEIPVSSAIRVVP